MTLSEDGQWMWDGNQWVPAQNAPPAAPPAAAQPGFSDPNNQSWNAPQPFGGQPMAASNPGGWAPESSSSSGGKSIPVAAIVAVVILIVAGATGGILWATGVFGSSADDLVGVWYDGDGRDGVQFKEDGSFVNLRDGSPSSYEEFSQTWSVSGDKLTIIIVERDLTGEFTCDNGDTINARWVNDGDNDCADNSDEGVDTSNMPYEETSETIVFLFEIEGDVFFLGYLSATWHSGGSIETESVGEDNLCEESRCYAWVRAGAMNNLNHATVVSGVTAPDWYIHPPDYDEDDN